MVKTSWKAYFRIAFDSISRSKSGMKRPPALYFLFFFHLFLSFNALIAGGLMILEPQGSLLQITPAYLSKSPFESFLFPGIILFMFNGLFPLFTFCGLLFKPNWHWADALNLYSDKHWGWSYSLYSGIILIIWITIQITLTPYYWLQPLFIGIGLLIIIFTMLSGSIRYFSIPK